MHRSVQNGSNLQIRWTDILNSKIQAQRAWFLVSNESIFDDRYLLSRKKRAKVEDGGKFCVLSVLRREP